MYVCVQTVDTSDNKVFSIRTGSSQLSMTLRYMIKKALEENRCGYESLNVELDFSPVV